jgi:hypothetical protein
MKHPVLKVKKDAVIYDDHAAAKEARRLLAPDLREMRAARPRRARGRRAGLSTASLLVAAIGVFLVFRQLPHNGVPRAELAGWQVTLRGTPHEGSLIVGLTFVSGTTGASPEAGARSAIAIVTLTGTDERLELEGALDRSPLTLRGEVPFTTVARTVRAEVTLGSSHVVLWVPMPKAPRP